MYKDYEVLSFCLDLNQEKVTFIKKLDHFEKAPHTILTCGDNEIDLSLNNYIHRRSIPMMRTGYQKILKATGCKSGFELAFRGHGLSLSNHYWYKREGENLRYDDINFFINKWDDSFAKAVLSQDYEALKHCNLNVPDVVTSGWGVKGWIYEEDGPKLFKIGINADYSEEAIVEVLASKGAERLFNKNEVLKHELRIFNNRYVSVSPLLTNIDEDLFPLSDYIDGQTYTLFNNMSRDKKLRKEFYERIKYSKIPGLYEFFIKMLCFKDLCFVSDLHFGNISLIKNEKTGQLRIAPLYDLGYAFGSSKTGKSIISKQDKSTLILVYYLFSDLEPDWDYSWYNPDSLIGFEDEIKGLLSKSDFYTPNLIEAIIGVYHQQKMTLDKMAKIEC